MTETLVLVVSALVVIAGATLLGPRLGIAAPLVLVAVGVGASFLPVFADVRIDPELILEGVLPPLLYSSAVSMPAMNFRREFGAISVLSVLLVVGSALLLGLFFMVVIPDLGFAWGVALGAIVSPTDAVATSIVKQTSVSQRVVAILDGESLLNDATALVLLRTAIAATAVSFSFGAAVGTFAVSVLVAVVVGSFVGWLNIVVRRRVSDPTVNTVISFAVPFLASVPAGLLHGSGLVAAVVAGLVTGFRAPRRLSPRHRLSDSQNWRTVELVLEGLVFLTMGLQIKQIVTAVQRDHAGVGVAVLIALGALAITVVVRAGYVAPLLAVLGWRSRATGRRQGEFREMNEKMQTPEGKQETLEQFLAGGRRRRVTERDLDRFSVRLRRGIASIEFFLAHPLGPREGAAVVWAGMRGAVTVAAAQTLPDDAPQRSVLVLVAFAVAGLSLLIQGGTVGPLLRRLAPPADPEVTAADRDAERTRLLHLMRDAAQEIPAPPRGDGDPTRADFEVSRRYRLDVLTAQRAVLLDARDDGTFDAEVLETALANLDADQIAMELRGELAA